MQAGDRQEFASWFRGSDDDGGEAADDTRTVKADGSRDRESDGEIYLQVMGDG